MIRTVLENKENLYDTTIRREVSLVQTKDRDKWGSVYDIFRECSRPSIFDRMDEYEELLKNADLRNGNP